MKFVQFIFFLWYSSFFTFFGIIFISSYMVKTYPYACSEYFIVRCGITLSRNACFCPKHIWSSEILSRKLGGFLNVVLWLNYFLTNILLIVSILIFCSIKKKLFNQILQYFYFFLEKKLNKSSVYNFNLFLQKASNTPNKRR